MIFITLILSHIKFKPDATFLTRSFTSREQWIEDDIVNLVYEFRSLLILQSTVHNELNGSNTLLNITLSKINAEAELSDLCETFQNAKRQCSKDESVGVILVSIVILDYVRLMKFSTKDVQ